MGIFVGTSAYSIIEILINSTYYKNVHSLKNLSCVSKYFGNFKQIFISMFEFDLKYVGFPDTLIP